MNVGEIVRFSRKMVSDNLPLILAGGGVLGVAATGVLSARAGFKAGMVMHEYEQLHVHELEVERTGREQFMTRAKMTWKLYLPSAASGVGTIAAIALAQKVNMQRMAGLAAAYSITGKAYEEYRSKVTEVIGDKKETEIRDKIAQERIDNSGDRAALIELAPPQQLCYDKYTGRYFPCSMESLKKAMNDVNYQAQRNLYVSLSEFYGMLGQDSGVMGQEVGWTNDKQMELEFTSTITPNNQTALVFDYEVIPIRRYPLHA